MQACELGGQTCNPATGSCEGVCSPGQQCAGNTQQACANGQWQDVQACELRDQTCNPATGGCDGVCSPLQKRCVDNTPQWCESGQWQGMLTGACVEQTCKGGKCIGACAVDTKRCLGNEPQTCAADGTWESGSPCDEVTPCVAGVCVKECGPGDLRCAGDTPQTCGEAGVWQNGPVCPVCIDCDPNEAACEAAAKPDCTDPIAIAAGDYHTCVLLPGGSAECWGYNGFGQLGLGDNSNRGDNDGEMGAMLPPVDLGPGVTVTALAAGAYHTCALLSGGSVKCWGANGYGQLGLGDTAARGDGFGKMGAMLPPVDLGPGVAVTALAAGGAHTCALLAGGSVKCWGFNDFGQLGRGDTSARGDDDDEMGAMLDTVDLGLGVKATAIAAGDAHTCALLSGGSVKCWGFNDFGQLGRGDTFAHGDDDGEMGATLDPIDLGLGVTATAIAGGARHTCALLSDGGIKCWGFNANGQLGLGDPQSRGGAPGEMGDTLPTVELDPIETATAIAGGDRHTCARLSGGSIKCWGFNSDGELGLGDQQSRGDSPGDMGTMLPAVDLGLGATATALTTGYYHTCVLLEGGKAKCWGKNAEGELGLGNKVNQGISPDQMGYELPFLDL